METEEKREAGDKRAVYLRTGIGIVISILRALFLARLLEPAGMSAYRLGTSWVGYFGFFTLGTVDTYYFHAPILLRTGETKEVQALRGVALTMVIGTAFIAGMGTTILLLVLRLVDVNTALLFGLCAFLSSWTTFLTIGFWVTGQFRRQARVELSVALLGFLFAIVGLWFYGLRGLLIGTCLSSALALWLARDLVTLGDIKLTTKAYYQKSIKFGMGQSAYVFMQGMVNSVDLQILAFLAIGQEALGIYSFATMLAVAVRAAASSGAVVSQTEILARYGQIQMGSGINLCEDAECQRRMDNLLVSLISLSALFFVVITAPVAFPTYSKVVEPLVGLTLAIITVRWGFFHAVALSTQSMQWKAMSFVAFGTGITALLTYIAAKVGWSLLTISLAPALGAAIYSLTTVIFCERTLAHRWGLVRVSRMLLILAGQLPILAVRAADPWYVNGLWVLLAIGVTILLSLVIDRPTLRATVQLLLMMTNCHRLEHRLRGSR